jgi:adenosylcobinamide-phosphate synthase
LLGFVPQILTSVILILASLLTPTAKIFRALQALFGLDKRAPFAEGGYPLSITAWALNISVGGPVQDLDGSVLNRAWVGPEGASAKVEAHHLKSTIYMSIMAHIILIAFLIAGLGAWKFFD